MKIFLTPLSILFALAILATGLDQPKTKLDVSAAPAAVSAAPAPSVNRAPVLASAGSMEELLDELGMDASWDPPIAWKCTKKIRTSDASSFKFEIIQNHTNGGLVFIDWGDGTEAFQALSGANVFPEHDYTLNNASVGDIFTVKIYTCEDDIEIIDVADQQLSSLTVDGLTGLRILSAHTNYIRSVIDLTASSFIEIIELMENGDGSGSGSSNTGWDPGSGSINLPSSCPNLKTIKCSYSAFTGSINLLGATAVEEVIIGYNDFTSLILPPKTVGNPPQNHPMWRLFIKDNAIPSLDVSNFKNLKYLDIKRNDMETFVLSGLDELLLFEGDGNKIGTTVSNVVTLDFTSSTNIEILQFNGNNKGLGGTVLPGSVELLLPTSCTQLTIIKAAHSNIVNTIDLEGATTIKDVIVPHNRITTFKAPPSQSFLERLYVYNNLLTGVFTIETYPSLKNFHVGNNDFTGIISTSDPNNPEEMDYPNLLMFKALGNRIEGTLSFSACSAMTHLDIGSNGSSVNKLTVTNISSSVMEEFFLNGGNHTGSIDLSACLALKNVKLNSNDLFHLVLPPANSPMLALEGFYIQYNLFGLISGSSVTSLNEIATRIESYGNNSLTGTWGLGSRTLSLGNNPATSSVPATLIADLTSNGWNVSLN